MYKDSSLLDEGETPDTNSGYPAVLCTDETDWIEVQCPHCGGKCELDESIYEIVKSLDTPPLWVWGFVGIGVVEASKLLSELAKTVINMLF